MEQWKAAWKKPTSRDPDAMDTTPGRARARKIYADERTELMKSGKCSPVKNKDTLVVIAPRDLLDNNAPILTQAPLKLRMSIAMMKSQPK